MSDEFDGLVPEIVEGAGDLNANDVRLTPGTRANCPKCGKDCHVTQEGKLRYHKCERGASSTRSRSGPGRKSRSVPAAVRDLAVDGIASGVEWSVSGAVSRYVPCPAKLVPARLPDADAMVSPLIDLLWPELPKSLQRTIASIAEHADLIDCAVLWAKYATQMKEWAQTAHEKVAEYEAEQERGEDNSGIRGETPGEVIDLRAVEPFTG